LSECKKQNVEIVSQSKVACKSIERAFYKMYYIYGGDHRQMTDLMRCSLVFGNFADLYHAFSIFGNNGEH